MEQIFVFFSGTHGANSLASVSAQQAKTKNTKRQGHAQEACKAGTLLRPGRPLRAAAHPGEMLGWPSIFFPFRFLLFFFSVSRKIELF
jgi:hypothetical protein